MRRFGDRLFPTYEAILADPGSDHAVLTHTLSTICDIPADRRRFRTPALRCLGHPSSGVRVAALELVGEIGDERNRDAVAPLLADEDAGVRRLAARTLAKLGGIAEPGAGVFALDSPPKDIADALGDLRIAGADKRKAAAAALAKLDAAEPYLRHYLTTPAGRADALARGALIALQAEVARRNTGRVKDWAKAGRFDLLVDVSLGLSEAQQADAVGEELLAFRLKVQEASTKLVGQKLRLGPPARDVKAFAATRGLTRVHESGEPVISDQLPPAFVRARSLWALAPKRVGWLVLTREELKGNQAAFAAGGADDWEDCLIVRNSDLMIHGWMTATLVVCDGDVTFVGGGWADGLALSSAVLARGSIQGQARLGFDSSCLYARGDIAAKGSSTTRGVLLAGGKIDVPRTGVAKESKDRVEKAGVKENPFGVRFFETADVGTETAMKGDDLTISELTPGSPLTRYGVKAGDVVTQLNDKPVKTSQDFRRELRYSVALEAGIFHVRRGDEKLTRVVYFKSGLEK